MNNTLYLHDLLKKEEQFRKVVHQKYVDLVATQVQAREHSHTIVVSSNMKIFGPIPTGSGNFLCEVATHIPDDTWAVVPVHYVIVHGVGGLENILQDLQHIADASRGRKAAGKPLKPISPQEYEARYTQTSSLRDWSR